MISSCIDRTRTILTSGDFKQDTAGSELYGLKVCEAQGSKELRQSARLLTLHEPEVLSPENLKLAQDANRTNYLFLKFKRLGHAFSMRTETPFAREKFSYEGFSEDFTIPMICCTLLRGNFQFASDILSRSFSNEWARAEDLEEALKTIHDPTSNKVVSIASGYDWHETHVFFFKGHLLYINKGSFNKKGINIYRIPDLSKVTLDHLSALSERQKYTRETYLSEDKLILELGLQHVHLVPLKNQKVGNCTYVSTKNAARALMAILTLLETPNPSSRDWVTAFNKIKSQYKEFVRLDRKILIDDLIDDLAQGEADFQYFSKTELFTDIFSRLKTFDTELFEALSKPFNEVTSLSIRKNLYLRDFNFLTSLTNLKVLSLEGCLGLKDFKVLEVLKNLTSLDLSRCFLDKCDSLVSLVSLKHLRLNSCYSLRDISHLKKLVNLEELSIHGDHISDEDYKILGVLTKLQNLTIYFATNLKNVSFLHTLPDLKQLTLKSCHQVRDSDLQFLRIKKVFVSRDYL